MPAFIISARGRQFTVRPHKATGSWRVRERLASNRWSDVGIWPTQGDAVAALHGIASLGRETFLASESHAEMVRRFYSRFAIEPSGCWRWTGTMMDDYGCMRVRGIATKAHRLSWSIHVGPIPDRLLVCHRCDYPPCVNPAHLFVGTVGDNNRDCIAKGRRKKAALTC